jgi:hypothetical protein
VEIYNQVLVIRPCDARASRTRSSLVLMSNMRVSIACKSDSSNVEDPSAVAGVKERAVYAAILAIFVPNWSPRTWIFLLEQGSFQGR